MNKLVVVAGPTATGKTSLALKLAADLNADLISCDSRQVYKHMDIITGKDIPQQFTWISHYRESDYVDHGYFTDGNHKFFGLNLVNPDQEFTVKQYLEYTYQILQECFARSVAPILVGGSGFYLHTLLSPPDTIMIPPNEDLRLKLSQLNSRQLLKQLTMIDSQKADKLNQSDMHNPHRLIRAIEVALYRSQHPQSTDYQSYINKKPQFKSKIIGLRPADKQSLYHAIDQRVDERIKQGAIQEMHNLKKAGWLNDTPALTLGYRQLIPYIQGELSLPEVIQHWKNAEHAYARRQLTWYSRMPEIEWIESNHELPIDQISRQVSQWLTSDSD